MVNPRQGSRRASSSSESSASSESSDASSHSSGSETHVVEHVKKHAEKKKHRGGAEPAAPPRVWRFLDTEETCHFFSNEMVISTNDVLPYDVEDPMDVIEYDDGEEEDEDGDSESDSDTERRQRGNEPGHETSILTSDSPTAETDAQESLLDPMQTNYEDIFSDFDDLYLPGITASAPEKLRKRRTLQSRQAARVLSSFCKDLQTGQSYLYRKRSEFLRVCFQRTLDLHRDQEVKETTQVSTRAEDERNASCGQDAFRFQCSRLERPLDVTVPELHPRKWPHLPYRDPREWINNAEGAVTFAKRVCELPEGSLTYEPIDANAFVSSCCELLKLEGIDVWSNESVRDFVVTESAMATLSAMLSVSIRLQSFSLVLFVAEVLTRYGPGAEFPVGYLGQGIVDITQACLTTLQAFAKNRVPPATYPRALVSQWKLCAYQPTTSDAVATDGRYLYIYGRTGLLKIGTGRGSTLRDFVYDQNKSYTRSRDAERSWLCLIDGFLYCRSIIMPSGRVDRISTSNLQSIDELALAPSKQASEHTNGSSTVYAMVTDGVALYTINSIDAHKPEEKRKSRTSRSRKSGGRSTRTSTTTNSTTGTTESASIRVGDRVVRGPDWKWGAQDGEQGSPGTVERISTWGGVKGCGITVRWDKNQRVNTYRWGAEGCFDIVVVVEKSGVIFEKKPLPRQGAGVKEAGPPTPRHLFIVSRYTVSTLLRVVDLDEEAMHSFLGISKKRPTESRAVDEDNESLLTAVHEHTLGISSATTAWMCDGATPGCLGDNSGVRFRCEKGCDFDLCDVCLAITLIGKHVEEPTHDVQDATAEAAESALGDESGEAAISTRVDAELLDAQALVEEPSTNPEEASEDAGATDLEELESFWCGLYTSKECQIALQRASGSFENAVTWMQDCGEDLKKAAILPCVGSVTLESPPQSSGLDPVLLVAGSFYAIGGQLCIVSPPGLYQGDKAKRSIHAADASWFFSLKDGNLLFADDSPVLLKSVPAGSPVCVDVDRGRVLVFSGYLNCIEEYAVGMHNDPRPAEWAVTSGTSVRTVGTTIYSLLVEASAKRWASRAYKRPVQGLQDWLAQTLQENLSAVAAGVGGNGAGNASAAKARTRRIKKLRARIDEFKKIDDAGGRGYLVPYSTDFTDMGLRLLLNALSRVIECLRTDSISRESRTEELRNVLMLWRGFLVDCNSSDVELNLPIEWEGVARSVGDGLLKLVFGGIFEWSTETSELHEDSRIVVISQDVLLWGMDVGLFDHLDRCGLLFESLHCILADAGRVLPPSYSTIMQASPDEVVLRSVTDCHISFVRRVLAQSGESLDGGIANVVQESSQVEDLCALLFRLSIREFNSKMGGDVGSHSCTPVEKALFSLFNGCAIDLMAKSEVVVSHAPRQRRLSSVAMDDSLFQAFAIVCFRACQELIESSGTSASTHDQSRLSQSVCSKLLPLVLAMICNGGRSMATTLKEPMIALSKLAAKTSSGENSVESSCLLPQTRIVESSHPYSRNQAAVRKVVRIPGASCLHIQFDPRCSTSGEADFVFVTPGHAWFHTDRVPFGENGIGDAGGCFFGTREGGNWPNASGGISIWGDTATIMLCSTSQERGSAGAEDESHRWGLKCSVRGIRLNAVPSWRVDVLLAVEYTLSVLSQRQLAACETAVDVPELSRAEELLQTLYCLGRSSDGNRNLAHEILAFSEDNVNSEGAKLVQQFETALKSQRRTIGHGMKTAVWSKAIRMALAIFVAASPISVEKDTSCGESSAIKTVIAAVCKVEQWMVRRVQLTKEWNFLQDDQVSLPEMVERLSSDTSRLKELCRLQGVHYLQTDSKRSISNLHGALLTSTPLRRSSAHEAVALQVIDKAEYALKTFLGRVGVKTFARQELVGVSPTIGIIQYLTSDTSVGDVRLANESIKTGFRHGLDACRLIQTTQCDIAMPTKGSLMLTGSLGANWLGSPLERFDAALLMDPRCKLSQTEAWAQRVSQNIRDSQLPVSVRLASLIDYVATYKQFRGKLSSSATQEIVSCASDLVVDIEAAHESSQCEQDTSWMHNSTKELAWVAFRIGVDTMFSEYDCEKAVSSLREMAGRLISLHSTKRGQAVHSTSLYRVMKMGCANINCIASHPIASSAWKDLCTDQVRTSDIEASISVQITSLRTLLLLGKNSSQPHHSVTMPALEPTEQLVSHLLEKVGSLLSSFKRTSEESENKLKDCCVIILDSVKARSKIAEALEVIHHETLDTHCLPAELLHLDLTGDLPQAPATTDEGTDVAGVVHRNVRCDGCNQSPMTGYRFKCFTCANYDLCTNCYSNHNTHNVDHQFVRLAKASGAGELLEARSSSSAKVVTETNLVGSKVWRASVVRAFLEAYGYAMLCRGSSEHCLQRSKTLSESGFAVTVMEWPDVKDLEGFYDWEGLVQTVLEPGSARLSRRASSPASSASASARKANRSLLARFNQRMKNVKDRHELIDPSTLISELVALTRFLMNRLQDREHSAAIITDVVEAVQGLGPQVKLLTEEDHARYNRTLGLMNVLGGFVEPLRVGARVLVSNSNSHPSQHRTGVVKQYAHGCDTVVVTQFSTRFDSDDDHLDESKYPATSLQVIAEIDFDNFQPVTAATTSFFPAFAAVLKTAHKLLKSSAQEIASDPGRTAATELVVSWLRMFMVSMSKLPSLLDHQASTGNGNMALLLFQLAKTSRSGESIKSLDAKRRIVWCVQQAVLSDHQFKLATRPIVGATLSQDTSCTYGPGANGQTDLTEYVFNLYAHSSRAEMPQHSGRNKLLEYWEKNVIPAIESYVAGSFKSYEMDYFFAQLREPLREGNSAAAMKIAFTLCDGHVPTGCHYPDPDTDWSALQIDDIEVGARYLITTCSGSNAGDWPLDMRWTVGHSGVVRTVSPMGLVLMQVWNPRTACLEHWWYQVENLAAINDGGTKLERSVDRYDSALTDLMKLDMELLGVIARKCVFAMLKQFPEQFPLVNDRQLIKNHFNIVDILRMASGSELGFEACTILGESDVGRTSLNEDGLPSDPSRYELMESLRFVLTKRFEFVPQVQEEAAAAEDIVAYPVSSKNGSVKYGKTGKVAGTVSPSSVKNAQGLSPSHGLQESISVVKYRYTLMEALVHELKRALDSSAAFMQQNAFMVASDSPPKSMIILSAPGASCLVISFAVHPVLMDLPAGSSLEFFRDEECRNRIFGFFGDKRGLSYLPPLVVPGDRCYVRASQASYARYKFRVDPLTPDFALALWIGDELHQRMASVTLSGSELESIVSSALSSITEYLVGGVATLSPCSRGIVCQLLTKVINFAISRSLSNAVPLSKLSVLTRDLAVAYDHELTAQKGLFSLPTQQLAELLATVEEVSRLKGSSTITLSTPWWPSFVRMATFTRVLTHKRDSTTSTDILARISCGRTPVEDIDEAAKLLRARDLLCERMILLQKLPRTKRVSELSSALSRFTQHIALEECGEADDQTVLSATEVLRFGILAKVIHLPVDDHGDTCGYAIIDVGRHDIIPRILLRLQRENLDFEGEPTDEDAELADKMSGAGNNTACDSDGKIGGDGEPTTSEDSVWSCGVCTLENSMTEVECAACGSPVPSDIVDIMIRRQSRHQPSSSRPRDSQATRGPSEASDTPTDSPPTGWQCDACTLENPWSLFECIACGSERNPHLVEPSSPGNDSDNEPSGNSPGEKSTLHNLSGIPLIDLVRLAADREVKQVTTFLVEIFTTGGTALSEKLKYLVHDDSAFVKGIMSGGGETIGRSKGDAASAWMLEIVLKEPVKVYKSLRESGYDFNLDLNHFMSNEDARASQVKWTYQMDIQLITLVRQIGAQIGVLSLLDMCPSHVTACDAPEGSSLASLESRDLRLRFVLLKILNKTALDALPLVNLRNASDPHAARARLVAVRQLLFPAVKIRFFAETQDNANLAQSNLLETNTKRPVVTLDRRRVVASRRPGEPLSLRDPKSSLFASTMAQLSQVKPSVLRAKRPTGASDPFVAFIVIFAGENVVGEGGPYRQLFNDIATELLSSGNPLFLPTQNSLMKIGEYRDRFLPNPSVKSRSMLRLFEFVGVLMGCCVRTGVHLNLRLAPIVWKMLVKQSLTVVDLEHIDWSVCESLKYFETAATSGDGMSTSDVLYDSFTTTLSDGSTVELKPGGLDIPVTKANCKEYVRLVKAARFQECKPQVEAILRGISTIVPVQLLQLCTWTELQQWVCGSLAIDVDLLKRHTLYSSGMTPDKFPHLKMFWRVLSSFSEENKRRFINFAWGQDTLPADDAEFDRTHTRLLLKAPPVTTANQDSLLPKADTCFFNIELPAYSSEEIMREKLLLAITLCTSMDGDEQTGRMDLYFSTDDVDDDHME